MPCRQRCPHAPEKTAGNQLPSGVAALVLGVPIAALMMKHGIEPWVALCTVAVGTFAAIGREEARRTSGCCCCRNSAPQAAAAADAEMPSWDYEPIAAKPKVRRRVWRWVVAAWVVAGLIALAA